MTNGSSGAIIVATIAAVVLVVIVAVIILVLVYTSYNPCNKNTTTLENINISAGQPGQVRNGQNPTAVSIADLNALNSPSGINSAGTATNSTANSDPNSVPFQDSQNQSVGQPSNDLTQSNLDQSFPNFTPKTVSFQDQSSSFGGQNYSEFDQKGGPVTVESSRGPSKTKSTIGALLPEGENLGQIGTFQKSGIMYSSPEALAAKWDIEKSFPSNQVPLKPEGSLGAHFGPDESQIQLSLPTKEEIFLSQGHTAGPKFLRIGPRYKRGNDFRPIMIPEDYKDYDNVTRSNRPRIDETYFKDAIEAEKRFYGVSLPPSVIRNDGLRSC